MNDKIIFYDGVCNLCNFFVRQVIQTNKKKNIKFAPLQSNFAKSKLPPEILKSNEYDSVIYLSDNQIYTKSKAVFEISKELQFPCKIIGYFNFLPKPFTDYVYKLIAENRYKFFGKKDSCTIPKGFDKSLFIDV